MLKVLLGVLNGRCYANLFTVRYDRISYCAYSFGCDFNARCNDRDRRIGDSDHGASCYARGKHEHSEQANQIEIHVKEKIQKFIDSENGEGL